MAKIVGVIPLSSRIIRRNQKEASKVTYAPYYLAKSVTEIKRDIAMRNAVAQMNLGDKIPAELQKFLTKVFG